MKKSRFTLLPAFLGVLIMSVVAGPALAATTVPAAMPVAKTTAKAVVKIPPPVAVSVLAKTPTNLKNYESAVQTAQVFINYQKDKKTVKTDINSDTISGAEIARLWAVVQKSAVAAPKTVKKETLSQVAVYHWQASLSAKGVADILNVVNPYFNTDALESGENALLKPLAKSVFNGTADVYIKMGDLVPLKVVINWSAGTVKSKITAKNVVMLQFTDYAKKAALVNTYSVLETNSYTANSSNGSANSQTSTSNAASVKAVDVSGQGGVTSQRVNNFSVVPGRDAARLADLKAFQTALELYNLDQGSYPAGSGVVLGGDNTSCLNADGWAPALDCPYPYMALVPADPKGGNYQYVYSGSGNSYQVTATLESVNAATGLQGKIILTPSGVTNQ